MTVWADASFIRAEFFINLPFMQMCDHFTVQCQQRKISSVKPAHGNVDCLFPLGTPLPVLVIKNLYEICGPCVRAPAPPTSYTYDILFHESGRKSR